MGSIVVHIEGEPQDVAEFIKHFQPASVAVPLSGGTYLTKDGHSVEEHVEDTVPISEAHTKEMVMQSLKHYGMRIQQQKGLADTSPYVKGLIHSVVGDSYTGRFESVGEEFYSELYKKAQGNDLFGTWE